MNLDLVIPKDFTEYFIFVIRSLRTQELLAMHGHFIPFEGEGKEILEYLEKEFRVESETWPSGQYAFNQDAALWAAKMIYNASQLLINRSEVYSEVVEHISNYKGEININTVLSIDLTLRFLPSIIEKLKQIDLDDLLITDLEAIGRHWHYSYMSSVTDEAGIDFSWVERDALMLQLYAEKLSIVNNSILMKTQFIDTYMKATLGLYKNQLIK